MQGKYKAQFKPHNEEEFHISSCIQMPYCIQIRKVLKHSKLYKCFLTHLSHFIKIDYFSLITKGWYQKLEIETRNPTPGLAMHDKELTYSLSKPLLKWRSSYKGHRTKPNR